MPSSSENEEATDRVQRAIELAMIGQDGWQLREMLGVLPNLPEAGALVPALGPHFAFYAVEAYEWILHLGKGVPQVALFRDHDAEIRDLRAHIKIESQRDGLDGLIGLLAKCEQNSASWFNRKHAGILGRLTRRLQDDLGLFFYNGDLISTTDVALANLSLGSLDVADQEQDPFASLAVQSRSFSEKVGRFIGLITSPLARPQPQEAPVGLMGSGVSIQSHDTKAAVFYAALGKQLGLTGPESAAFTFLVSSVNIVHRVLRRLMPERSDFFFRVKYLTAHHALEALGRFNAAVRKRGDANSFVGRMVAEMRRDGRIFKKVGDKLRNNFAHYSLRELAVPSTVPASPSLRGLLENHSPPTSEIDAMLDTQLEAISTRCREVLQP